jgi:beta-galactosidase
MRTIYQFNAGWKFHWGDLEATNHDAIHANRFKRAEWMKAGNHGVARAAYPDADWQSVDLPHDFVVSGTFSEKANAVHGSLPTDAAWYRKTFEIPEAVRTQRIHLEFDGIYRDATIWVNGHLAGNHLSGYTSFSLDITELCEPEGLNVVAVRCDAREFELWSYEGGGIYREVRLVATDSLYVPYCGTCVRSHFAKENDFSEAVVALNASVENAGRLAISAELNFKVFEAGESQAVYVARQNVEVDSGERLSVDHQFSLKNPQLWSPQSPELYRLETELRIGDSVLDLYETTFGVRAMRFDAEKGCFLNGEPIQLKGVCNHQDHAGVGVAMPPTLDAWRLEQLKAMGCNAIRTAHNPPAPHLLDLCDRMGFIVMDEARLPGTAPELLGQLESLILRDRNHPSVFLWSLGNEEMLIQENATGPKILERMQALTRRLDPTRPCVYSANCDFNAIAENFEKEGFRVDVFGANYTMRHNAEGRLTAEAERYDEFKTKFPDWPLVASESGGSASTRGLYGQEFYEGAALNPHPEAIGADAPVYLNPKRAGQVTAYGETLTPWGRSIEATWEDCARRDFLMGTFLWTGFDYRGETYPFSWPAVVTRYGLMDLCGFPKDSFYYYQAEWIDAPVLHLFPHWNLDCEVGEVVDLWAYTNCAAVELWLNGESQGKRERQPFRKVQWEVPYEAGTLEAVGYDANGVEQIRTTIQTTGAAQKIELSQASVEVEADGHAVAIINVSASDSEGRAVPTAHAQVDFEISASAQLLGVGNGNPTSHELEQAPRRRLFNGKAQLILRSHGEASTLMVRAHAQGLDSGILEIQLPVRAAILPSIGGSTAQSDGHGKLNPVDGSL